MQKVWEGSLDDHVTSNTWASIWKNKTKTSNSVSSNTVFGCVKHIYFLIGATKKITLIDIHLLTQCIDAHLENTLQQLLFLLTFSPRN